MANHYILRVGDAHHFNCSSKKSIWGINSKRPDGKFFISNVKEGDLLWFIKGKSRGKIIAVATFIASKERVLGPLIATSFTNEELGWTETDGEWDTEIHYKNLYNLNSCELYSEIKSPLVIRCYNEKCKINLPAEYPNIVRYSKITTSM
jgi:hypothetical protein